MADFEFINRTDELSRLDGILRRTESPAPPLVILRSPAGFGKSRLTQELSTRCQIPNLTFCFVDPEIRSALSGQKYDGFFLQRCAERLSALSTDEAAPWISLDEFMKSRRWRTVKEKKAIDLITETPGKGSAYKVLFDYASRAFSFGNFSPEKILSSDSKDAVRICSDYVDEVLSSASIALVIIGTQWCDTQSFKSLLLLNETAANLSLIFEYTTSNGDLQTHHKKILARAYSSKRNYFSIDIYPLSLGHLQHLIKTHTVSDHTLSIDTYKSWDGNLLTLLMQSFQVGTTQRISAPEQIGQAFPDFSKFLEDQITSISSQHRMLLAICIANAEPIGIWLIERVLSKTSPIASGVELNRIIKELVEVHKLLLHRDDVYYVHNDTVLTSLQAMPRNKPAMALAESTLRDQYLAMILDKSYDGIGLTTAVRQAFRLCAATKDITGLLRLIDVLSADIYNSQDPSLYVNIVHAAISSSPHLYANDHEKVVTWAADLAYEIGDWKKAANLIAMLAAPSSVMQAMRACALQEIGGHEEALVIANTLRVSQQDIQNVMLADLIEAIVVGCQGRHSDSRRLLEKVIHSSENSTSPLLGYAYRFFEIVGDYKDSISSLKVSIDYFERFGLRKSKAYSQAAASVLLARHGDFEEARAMIEDAGKILNQSVRDQHLLLNNEAAVSLLSDQPDYEYCKNILLSSLRHTRDDYSEITILSNLSIAYCELGEFHFSLECIEKIVYILRDPDFADREIYWPLYFNASKVLEAAGNTLRAKELLDTPANVGVPVTLNQPYWAYRYGLSDQVNSEYQFLTTRRYHPLYLSHWTLDLDGLNLLRKAVP